MNRPSPSALHPAPFRFALGVGVLVVLLLLLVVAGCDRLVPPGGEGGGGRADPFSITTANVVVEVDFEDGAAPFTGPTVYGDTWDLTVESVSAMVPIKSLAIPRTLDEMGALSDVPDGDLDRAAVLALADASDDVSVHGAPACGTSW